MKLFNVDFRKLDELDPLFTLKKLFDVTGNCPESGYLGDEFTESGFNENHYLEFATRHIGNNMDVKTKGIVLPNGVTLKQVRTMGDVSTNYLYSWDTNNNEYSCVTFDNTDALDSFYNHVVSKKVNLCDVDIDEYFKDSGLHTSSILDIESNQQLDPLLHVMDDYEDRHNHISR